MPECLIGGGAPFGHTLPADTPHHPGRLELESFKFIQGFLLTVTPESRRASRSFGVLMVKRLVLFTVNVCGSLMLFLLLAMMGLLLTTLAILKD